MKSFTCSCGVSENSKRIPRGWVSMPTGPMCPACKNNWRTLVVSLPVRGVLEPEGVSLLDSLREAWGLATSLANWCQLECIKLDVIRTPEMTSLPKCHIPNLYSHWNRNYQHRDKFAGCCGSAAAIIRECEWRWRHHPRFGRFPVLWKRESTAATYTYPYPWIVRAQEAKLTREPGQSPVLSVTVPGGRNTYRLAGDVDRRRQLDQVDAVLRGDAKMGDVKLCPRWAGGKIVGVDAKMAVTMRKSPKLSGMTASISTTSEALLKVEANGDKPWLYHADNLRGVLAAYERWRHRAATDLKHEKRWPSHTRRRIVHGMQDRIQRHHARLKTGIEQAVSMALLYAQRQGCATVVFDDRDRGAIPGNFPWFTLRERMRLTAENLGMEIQLVKGEEDASKK